MKPDGRPFSGYDTNSFCVLVGPLGIGGPPGKAWRLWKELSPSSVALTTYRDTPQYQKSLIKPFTWADQYNRIWKKATTQMVAILRQTVERHAYGDLARKKGEPTDESGVDAKPSEGRAPIPWRRRVYSYD